MIGRFIGKRFLEEVGLTQSEANALAYFGAELHTHVAARVLPAMSNEQREEVLAVYRAEQRGELERRLDAVRHGEQGDGDLALDDGPVCVWHWFEANIRTFFEVSGEEIRGLKAEAMAIVALDEALADLAPYHDQAFARLDSRRRDDGVNT